MSSSLRAATTLATILWLLPLAAHAQQPFVTDDADVTERHKFHFEFSNEFDLLQASALPARRQNTATFDFAYGLFEGVEISLSAPLINIFNARGASPRTVSGIGDTSLSIKYNLLKEREGLRRPALSASLSIELPTGDVSKGLGSGLFDFYLNGILQKSLTARTKLRLNGGIVFAGNTAEGALGVRARGSVWTGGGSLVREFTNRLQLGAELTGAVPGEGSHLSRGQLQAQAGGNYQLRENLTLDFGIIGGRFAASPRLGAQLGVSVDF